MTSSHNTPLANGGTNSESNVCSHDKDDCPNCGKKMTQASFRTGSVSKPKEESLACQKCGTRVAVSD